MIDNNGTQPTQTETEPQSPISAREGAPLVSDEGWIISDSITESFLSRANGVYEDTDEAEKLAIQCSIGWTLPVLIHAFDKGQKADAVAGDAMGCALIYEDDLTEEFVDKFEYYDFEELFPREVSGVPWDDMELATCPRYIVALMGRNLDEECKLRYEMRFVSVEYAQEILQGQKEATN